MPAAARIGRGMEQVGGRLGRCSYASDKSALHCASAGMRADSRASAAAAHCVSATTSRQPRQKPPGNRQPPRSVTINHNALASLSVRAVVSPPLCVGGAGRACECPRTTLSLDSSTSPVAGSGSIVGKPALPVGKICCAVPPSAQKAQSRHSRQSPRRGRRPRRKGATMGAGEA